jgi:hypothetical protein
MTQETPIWMLTSGRLERPADAGHAEVGVEVRPPEREDLAAAHARGEPERDRQLEARALRGREQPRGQLRADGRAFRPAGTRRLRTCNRVPGDQPPAFRLDRGPG